MRFHFVQHLIQLLLIFVLLTACSNQGTSSGVNMEPGLWEISTSIENSQLPIAIPPTTATQCLTESNLVPQSSAENSNCKIENLKTSGDTISYTATCSAGGTTTVSKAEIVYHGTSMNGTIATEMTGGPTAMNMTYRLKGKRIGNCN
jgi:hypothetical protein